MVIPTELISIGALIISLLGFLLQFRKESLDRLQQDFERQHKSYEDCMEEIKSIKLDLKNRDDQIRRQHLRIVQLESFILGSGLILPAESI